MRLNVQTLSRKEKNIYNLFILILSPTFGRTQLLAIVCQKTMVYLFKHTHILLSDAAVRKKIIKAARGNFAQWHF